MQQFRTSLFYETANYYKVSQFKRGRVNVSDQHRPQHPLLVDYNDISFFTDVVFLWFLLRETWSITPINMNEMCCLWYSLSILTLKFAVLGVVFCMTKLQHHRATRERSSATSPWLRPPQTRSTAAAAGGGGGGM